MSAKIVLDYYLDQYQTLGNTLSDISFDNLSFLQEREPVYNMKGQKVSKSYYDKKGKEVVRITYGRVFGNYEHNGKAYSNVFLGLQKTVHYMDWAGEIAYSKKKQLYAFDLQPVFLGDGNETVVGFSSQKQRQILKSERFSADDYLQAMNPQLYAILYAHYTNQYNAYLRTGIKTEFVSALNAEASIDILALLDKEVYGCEPMTVKELIIMNLQ
ncbi:hypothetical protein [Flavobacterium aestivum]|uniref:hypothetical protein n=1 Tax=Flavobacterium aestivum TaxID=3003257 RepID=UPI0022863BAF|nr:hypothetical protein [Flavobacterium aestivum]